MPIIRGISHLTEQGYRYTDVQPVPYKEQVIAQNHMLYEQAAIKYWEVIGYTDDRGAACYAAALIAPKCLLDEDFWKILNKREPPPRNFR